MFAIAGKIIQPGAPFTDSRGTQYPAGWITGASPTDRDGIGLQDVVYVDERPAGADVAYLRTEDFDGDHTVTACYTRRSSEQIRPPIIEKIKAHCWALKAAGVPLKVDGEEKWFDSDDAARIQHLGLLQLAACNAVPTGLQWKCMDGSFITMTPAIAQAIFAATANADFANFANGEAHIAAVGAADKPELYDWSTGWMQRYPNAAQAR
jgi:hypothetical protein